MKNKTSITRLFAILVSALMMVFAMSAFAVAEDYSFYDETERYIDEGGLTQEIRHGNGEGEFKVLAIDWLPTETLTLEPGWYLLAGGGSITSRVEVKGDVKIILKNEREMKFDGGLHVPEGSTLTIYGQTRDYSRSGKLIAQGEDLTAGIGGNASSKTDEQKTGTINIYGGIVEATGGLSGAGIGGGYGYIIESTDHKKAREVGGDGGTINIYTGEVAATGGAGGAGLGGGFKGDSGSINIYGGTITAKGGSSSYGGGSGIGGGCGGHINYNGLTGGNANDITITGGRVKAYGAGGGAGIGAGAHANGSKVWYENFVPQHNWVKIGGIANVYAKGSDGGAGIGGAMDELNDWYEEGGGCNVEIYGSARVEAIGGAHAAGIGAARSDYQGAGETIIKGYATVIAQGGDYAAGIGCADKIVTLSWTAKYRRLYDIKISGHADVTATGGKEAAGIGCGDEGRYGKDKYTWEAGNQGIVRITGDAKVKAKGDKYGAGIGGGDQQVNGYIEIGGPVYETLYSSNGRIDDVINTEEEKNNNHNPTVTATGGYGAAGIGCGDDTYDGAGCAKMDFKGGTVNATGGEFGAGIGGADGSVYNETITITGGKITAKGVKQAAGIGGGNHWTSHGGGDGGPVDIELPENGDDFVLAVSDSEAAPIGRGDGGEKDGDLTLGGMLSVKKSSSKMEYKDINAETPSPASWRVKDCQSDVYKTVLIQYCSDSHKKALVYSNLYEEDGTLDKYIHKVECPYCEFTDTENHTPYKECVPDHPERCTKCGEEQYRTGYGETGAMKANTLTAKNRTVKVRKSRTKKFSAKKVLKVRKAKGKVTYRKANKSGGKKIKVSKTGKITVKKGLKKGTYKVRIKVRAAGNAAYKSKTVTKTLKIKVR